MDEKQKEQLEKFKLFTGWMYGDCKVALDKTGAQFLVAMALFNYIETLGAFLIGYYKKDNKGIIVENAKGKEKTSCEERFNSFFSYLGPEYESLSFKHSEIYDELRCGMTHEFLPKNRRFSIAKAPEGMTTDQIDSIKLINFNSEFSENLNCGVLFLSTWFVLVPKLAKDFEKGVKKLISEIEKEIDQKLVGNFFETANQINMENFK